MFILKYFRYSGLQFFDIKIFKNIPKLVFFIYFNFKMNFFPYNNM